MMEMVKMELFFDYACPYCYRGYLVPAGFQKSIGTGRYRKQLEEGKRYAWEINGLDAVPSYRSGKHFIGSKDGFLVPEKQLAYFLDGLVE